MSNLNIPPPSGNKRPRNTYEWLGLTQKIIKEAKGLNWDTPNIMTIKQLGDSIDNDLNFKQTMYDTIEESFRIAYTPKKILDKLKTVDGLGSGLDSDFVRGYVPVNKAGDTMSGFLSLHADPEQAFHAVTKNYVDSLIEGFVIKLPVRVATTENITLSGIMEIDKIPVRAGDRILVKNQTIKTENGIYVVSDEDWTRSSDANSGNELRPGTYVFVNEGIINRDSSWIISNDSVVIDETEIEFIQFSGTGQILPGVGLAKDGNRIYMTNTGISKGTYTKLTIDEQGRATVGTTLSANDIPSLDWSKITTGKPTTVQGYGITNAVRSDISNTINANSLTLNGNSNVSIKAQSSKSMINILLADKYINTTWIQSGIITDKEGIIKLSGMDAVQLKELSILAKDGNVNINGHRILTLNDQGSGNGIDADKLDGLHGTSYMRTDVDTSTIGSVEIRKASSATKSALSVISPDTGDASISLLRTGSGLRSWVIKASEGNLVFGSKLDTETTFTNHIRFNTTDKQIYVGDNIVWNRGNDGHGSGLDADKLDGQHGDFYRNASNINTGTLNNSRLSTNVFIGENTTYSHNEESNFNFRRSGFKRITGDIARIHWANPINTGDNSCGIEMTHSGNGTVLSFYKYSNTGNKISDWKIWHEGRQGHGTGMDADTIDGKHYNDLNNLFVSRVGDTMTGHLKLHADPTDPLHAATKQYVDGVVQGLDFKQSVVCATTVNITLTGLQTIDGVVIKQADRVLVKDQTNKAQNGIYNATAGEWVRTSDANHINKLNHGAYVFVEGGVKNISSGWVVDNVTSGDIGIAQISFIQFSGAGQIIAGTGLAKNGNEIYLKNTGISSGVYTKLTIDSQGRATAGTSLVANDIPSLDWSKITTGKPTTVQGYGITNAVRTDTGGTVNGALNINDGNIALRASRTDHTFMSFYPRNNSGTRGGYIGFGGSGTTSLSLFNDIGNLNLGNSSRETVLYGNLIKSMNNMEINKVNGRLIFRQPSNTSAGKETGIDFISNEGQNVSIEHVFFDSDTPIAPGNGIRFKKTGGDDTFFIQTMGEIYAGATGLSKVWHGGNFNPGNYLPLTGGTLTGGINISNDYGIKVRDKLTMAINNNPWVYVGANSNGGDCYTRYKDNGHIEFHSGKYDRNGLLYNNNKVWHAGNDGSGSGLDADLLDGANSSTAPTANTIPKRGTDGSLEATTTKTNKIELGTKAEIVFNVTDNSIDFIIK